MTRSDWSKCGKAIPALLCAVGLWMTAVPAGEAKADYTQSKTWFEALSPAGRTSLQNELFWSGDYPGPIDGRFGPLTYASLTDFQARAGGTATGILSEAERAALQDEAQRIRRLVNQIVRQSRPPQVRPQSRPKAVRIAQRVPPAPPARTAFPLIILP